MLLDLGPYPASDALRWTKFARRVLLEIECDPLLDGELSPDAVSLWRTYINDWSASAERHLTNREPFRWQTNLDAEVAEFLLHGLDQCWHSSRLANRLTPEDVSANHDFTMHVIRAFIDGLADEGRGCEHYANQITASFAGLLD